MFLVVAFTVQLTSQYVFKPWQEPRFDAARYLNYAVNLYEHGVFGLSPPGDAAAPPPSRGNTPLYPAILAGVFHLGEPPPEQLRCYLRLGDGDCAYSFAGVRAAQALIAVTALAMIWFASASCRSVSYFTSSYLVWFFKTSFPLSKCLFASN